MVVVVVVVVVGGSVVGVGGSVVGVGGAVVGVGVCGRVDPKVVPVRPGTVVPVLRGVVVVVVRDLPARAGGCVPAGLVDGFRMVVDGGSVRSISGPTEASTPT